ncbi:putative RNA-binding domain superfamily [Helianthus annuus]|nr:putative RNA-binding domain superfamily [Helianthus annuus]KAJ0778243.1 putative RNA-binding domain superfamily [Helianthus annuus]
MANVPPFQPPIYSQGMHGYAYQSMGEVSQRPLENEETTLLIRHLPEAIPHDTLSRLFSHYGASSVRPCTTGRYIRV